MSTCPGCGGVVGRDCWNPQECEWISRDMERRHHEEQGARQADAEIADLRARLAAVEAALMQGGQTAQIRCTAAMLALDGWTTTPPNAPAAARGEGDRPVEPPCTCDGPVTQDGAQHRTWCGQEGDRG